MFKTIKLSFKLNYSQRRRVIERLGKKSFDRNMKTTGDHWNILPTVFDMKTMWKMNQYDNPIVNLLVTPLYALMLVPLSVWTITRVFQYGFKF